ncbi:hypothetical protein ACOME3_001008 [Neoechinorhynchus agilis]
MKKGKNFNNYPIDICSNEHHVFTKLNSLSRTELIKFVQYQLENEKRLKSVIKDLKQNKNERIRAQTMLMPSTKIASHYNPASSIFSDSPKSYSLLQEREEILRKRLQRANYRLHRLEQAFFSFVAQRSSESTFTRRSIEDVQMRPKHSTSLIRLDERNQSQTDRPLSEPESLLKNNRNFEQMQIESDSRSTTASSFSALMGNAFAKLTKLTDKR